MNVREVSLESAFRRVAAVAVTVAFLIFSLVVSKWAFGHAVAINAAEPEVAAFGAELTPSDPRVRFEYALLLEKTLLADDQEKARQEYAAAASLSPNNYVFWLALGRSREQAGDQAGAEQAVRRAVELAPNYARVRWALGNLLVRKGEIEAGFPEVRTAVASDVNYAGPASALAWQVLGGDLARVRASIGDEPLISGALASLLARDKRYAEALAFWRMVPAGLAQGALMENGREVAAELLKAGLYSSAAEVAVSTGQIERADPPDRIADGDFESLRSQKEDPLFSWMIDEGTFPNIGLNQSKKRSGTYSLLLNFGSGGRSFRSVARRVGVQPGNQYTLSLFYFSDLQTAAVLKWSIVSAPEGKTLASLDIRAKSGDWSEARADFTAPPGVEGVDLRLVREGCPAEGCIIAGNIWFDDISLARFDAR